MATLLAEHPGSTGSVGYEDGQATKSAGEGLYSWAARSTALHAYDVTTSDLNRCHHFNSGGAWIVEPMNLGQYGQLRSAYQVSFTQSGSSEGIDLLVALKGRAVVDFTYADDTSVFPDMMSLDLSDIQSLASIALSKVRG